MEFSHSSGFCSDRVGDSVPSTIADEAHEQTELCCLIASDTPNLVTAETLNGRLKRVLRAEARALR
jgi:hypothetical protein